MFWNMKNLLDALGEHIIVHVGVVAYNCTLCGRFWLEPLIKEHLQPKPNLKELPTKEAHNGTC